MHPVLELTVAVAALLVAHLFLLHASRKLGLPTGAIGVLEALALRAG
jgi:hypothetical protein